MILWLDEIGYDDIAAAGGKAAGLGEMIRAGFPVPPGFCVTVKAYRQHLAQPELRQPFDSLLDRLQEETLAELEKTTAEFREMIATASLSAAAEAAIRQAYRELVKQGHSRVAVRSSATAEDLPEASFAGQQETFLSLTGEDAVLEHVKKCWASLWTVRSILYRQHNGFDHRSVDLAVVAQAMVEAEQAGVLFTVNPLSGKRDEMLVNAAYGLGESVVSGRVTPDQYRISKKGRRFIIESQLGAKEIQIRTGPDGQTQVEQVAADFRSLLCLQKHQLKQLRQLGLKVEAYCRAPQDIEWAWAGGKLYLLQTRPVTTLIGFGQAEEAAPRTLSLAEAKVLDNAKEHIPDPPYPLEYDTLLGLNRVKNATFYDLGIVMPPAERMLRMDAHGIPIIGDISPRPGIRVLGLPWHMRRMLKASASGAGREQETRLETALRGLQAVGVESLEDRQLADYITQAVNLATGYGEIRFRFYVFPMVLRGTGLKLFLRWAGMPRHIDQYDFLAGLDYKSALIEQGLYELAGHAQGRPEVRELLLTRPVDQAIAGLESLAEGRIFLNRLQEFIGKHGARTPKPYLPFSNCSWSENPEFVISMLSAILRSDKTAAGKENIERGREKYQSLKKQTAQKLPVFLRKRFFKILEQFRRDHQGREATLYAIEECYAAARAGVGEAGERLMRRGDMEKTEDVKYLTLQELHGVLSGAITPQGAAKAIKIRKMHRPRAENVWNPQKSEDPSDHGGQLRGLAGSPGKVRGTACLIAGPSEFDKLRKGDVLVCTYTDPTWTPLFSIAAAVVCDTGGPLSHAAIVAREYGLPAVLGVKKATALFRDGDLILVDGFRGTVTRDQ